MSKSSKLAAGKSGGLPWSEGASHDLFLPQIHDRELTVVAWNNLKGLMAAKHPGHAALLMRKRREQDMWKIFRGVDYKTFQYWIERRDLYRYFSFFPFSSERSQAYSGKQHGRQALFSYSYLYDMQFEISKSALDKLRDKTATLRQGQYYLGQDMKGKNYFGTRAEMVVPLPLQADNGTVHIGFNAHEICMAANAFKTSDHFAYLFVSTDMNCSGVASRLMHAGGGTAFSAIVGYVPKHHFYVTPNDVVEYAIQAENGLYKLNVMLQALWQVVGQKAIQVLSKEKYAKDNPIEIYTIKEWKKRSAVSFKTRGLVLREVDKYIERYHKHRWDKDFPEKMAALCMLILNVYKHFQLSSSGKRDDAFIMLAHQIVRQVRMELVGSVFSPWPKATHYGVGT